jgi:micrococcal nuclease
MKTLLSALLFVSLIGCTTAKAESVRIESCYDGDTCTTTTGEKIRLACVDTPEINGPNRTSAILARDAIRRALVGRKVELQRLTTDKYNRTVGEISMLGVNIGEMMVAAGHAVIVPEYASQCAWTSHF